MTNRVPRWGNENRQPHHVHIWLPNAVFTKWPKPGVQMIRYKICRDCKRVLL